jgi:hypothetical protein
MQLARQKLGKKNTSQSWRPPLPYGHHGALPPATLHTTISQHAGRQVYDVTTREYYCIQQNLLAILRHDASLRCALPVCLLVASAGGAERIILSTSSAESIMLSACAEGI